LRRVQEVLAKVSLGTLGSVVASLGLGRHWKRYQNPITSRISECDTRGGSDAALMMVNLLAAPVVLRHRKRYVGSHMASIAVPGTNEVDVTWNGTMTNLIWHAAYFGMLDSMTGRYALAVDWLKAIAFGRSTATSSICTDHSKAHDQALLRRHNNDDTAAPPKPKKSRLLTWLGFGPKK